MKKIVLLLVLVIIAGMVVFAGSSIQHSGYIDIPFLTARLDDENICFNASYAVISDSMLAAINTQFTELEIQNVPFAQVIYFIGIFDDFLNSDIHGCLPLDSILLTRKSNNKSTMLAICALMQYAGWDVLCFYNELESYLGLNLSDEWAVRKGNWVEKDGRKYYLKEINLSTPVGSLLVNDPAAKYFSVPAMKENLEPIPCVQSLPPFGGEVLVKKLLWQYHDSLYTVLIFIPEEQAVWTRNLPPSLYGMAYSGMVEIQNMGLLDQLEVIVGDMSEYDGVNCLYKFCQSEGVFIYDNTQTIKSVSQQFIDGRNDCDGRSVVLYVLLRTLMGYKKDDIVFVGWPNHIALGVKPATDAALKCLRDRNAFSMDGFYILDAAYSGDTRWGDKMSRLSDTCEIIQ